MVSDCGTTIHDLPTELLSIIFQFSFIYSRIDDTRTPSAEDLRSEFECLFPYGIASICKLWADITAGFPHFWTRIVIFIDAPNFSSFQVKLQLERSCKLPLQVAFICEDPEAFEDSPGDERSRTEPMLNVLEPHFHRCEKLPFDVTYTSSLPHIITDLPVIPSLTSLSLTAFIADGLGGYSSAIPHLSELQFPALMHLDIDGYSFVDLFQKFELWIEEMTVIGRSTTIHISISRYDRQYGRFFVFSALDILLTNFASLTLHDVDFDHEPRTAEEHHILNEGHVGIGMDNVTLSHLSGPSLAAIVPRLGADSLNIIDCRLDDLQTFPRRCDSLLQRHERPRRLVSFYHFLHNWEGHELTFTDCSALDDDIIHG